MIIALFGRSGTGKTTLARAIRPALGLPLRSCGDAIRNKANLLGVPWRDLPDAAHREVDSETRLWVSDRRSCIVEGRYLDYVLAPLGGAKILVHLTANDDDRSVRQMQKSVPPSNLVDFRADEEMSLTFEARIYSTSERLAASFELNTSELSVEACLQRLKNLAKSL